MSLSQLQIQELLNNPPKAGAADPAFAGRDWQHIGIGELAHAKDLIFVEWNTSVEAATNVGTGNDAAWGGIWQRAADSLHSS